MGKGQKKKTDAGLVLRLEEEIASLKKQRDDCISQCRAEIAELKVRHQQSIKDLSVRKVTVEKSSTVSQNTKAEIQKKDLEIKNLKNEVARYSAREKFLTDTLKDTRQINNNLVQRQEKEIARIETLLSETQEQLTTEKEKNHKYLRTIAIAEAENLRQSIEEEFREEYKRTFEEKFEEKNKKTLEWYKKEHERRREQVNQRNEEYASIKQELEQKIKETDHLREELEKEREDNSRLYAKNEAMRMEHKRIMRDIESAKLDYEETEFSVTQKKEELDTIIKGSEEAIEKYRIKNGEIKVLYYTMDDTEMERFYDDDIQEEIRKVEEKENDSFQTKKIGKWIYKICLVSDVLMQINTHTKKTRPIMKKTVNLSELTIPKMWTPGGDIIKYIDINEGSDEFRYIKSFFMKGWYQPGDSYYRDIQRFKIVRIENKSVWGKYISANYEQTNPISRRHSWNDHISQKDGEYLCWHGTEKYKATNGKNGIVEVGAKIYFSGTGSGCMYGQGFYGANQSKKSDQYSGSGWNTMLLCGFNMGRTYHTNGHHQDSRRPPDGYDSIYAAGNIANYGRQIHDEFIVFDSDQVYPYYIVEYQ